MSDKIQQFFSSKFQINIRDFSRRFAFQSLMRIHKVVNRALHVQETFRAFVASKVTHRFYPVFYVTVVSFYRIVIVLQPVFPARYRHAEVQRACTIKQFVERIAIILEAVCYKGNQPALPRRLALFLQVNGKDLVVARVLYLSHEFHAFRNRAFYAV